MLTINVSHHNCQDGFAAATIVREKIEVLEGRDYQYWPGKYSEGEFDRLLEEVRKHGFHCVVVITDFSYKPEQMVQLAKEAGSVLWIDHHDTAIKAWQQYVDDGGEVPRNLLLSLSNAKSGALLTWEYLFDFAEPPRPIHMISDRDLWQFKLRGSKELAEYLFSHPYDFSAYRKVIFSRDDRAINEWIVTGGALLRSKLQLCKAMADTANCERIGSHFVGVVNVPYYHASDTLHIVLEESEILDYALSYYVDHSVPEVSVSLRSRPGGVHVGEIAKQFGGGGHASAAGYKVIQGEDINEFGKFITS